MLGIVVMLKNLQGNESTIEALRGVLNKKISSIELNDPELVIKLTNKKILKIWDSGQSCCESRYMRCDDNFKDYHYATILDFELADVDSKETDYGGMHEVQFLRIKTDKGTIVISNHNEHNGYYGGFFIEAKID